jgi:hypothetical protein
LLKKLIDLVNSPLISPELREFAVQPIEYIELIGRNLTGILVAVNPCMISFKKEILREAAEICKLSSLYTVFNREEKREAVRYIYSLIDGAQARSGEALENVNLSVR